MATRRALLLVLLLAVLAAAFAWRTGWMSPRPAPVAVAPAPTPTPPPALRSLWKTEQEWLVDRIVRDIRATAAWARDGRLPAAETGLAGKGMPLGEHVFAPSAYAALAREALAGVAPAVDPRAAAEVEDERLVSALVDLRSTVLLRENAALSRSLADHPLDAAAHARAALLLGAFALRDAAGRSTDVRPALCRMTAHLAVAAALRGDAAPGVPGRLAEAVLVTLAGRERDALARLDSLQAEARVTRALRAWLRALRLRNTGDWRMAVDARDLTLLERLEEFRALARGQDDAAALEWLDRGRRTEVLDWGLLAMNAEALSVETANRFADVAPALQVAEAGEAWVALGGPAVDEAGMMRALDERPAGLVATRPDGRAQPDPLGWGLWADRAQRHLVFELQTVSYYYTGLLGRAGAARAYVESARQRFGRLEMYPVVLCGHAFDADSYRSAMAAVRELALRSPERLTAGHWDLFRDKTGYGPVPSDLPDEASWFRPALPAGTLLDVDRRLQRPGELAGMPPETLRSLREMAPHDIGLALFDAARQPADRRNAASLAAVYGPLAEFNVRAMGKLADASWYDPAGFREWQGRLCEIVPDRCFMLGYRLAELGLPDEAAAAYQKAFDRANDRVAAANQCRWLVRYYVDHGQVRKAEVVARQAAGTGAASGLFVLAELLERKGRLGDAEEQYRQILDRYQDPERLAGFYFRQIRAGHAEYESRFRNALALALPEGLLPLDRGALDKAPVRGAVVRKENDNTKRWGIKWGDVIVALDGYRVHGRRSFDVINELSLAPRMDLVVWRGSRFVDVTAELWDRRFRVDIEDLAPPARR
ncbi:MAG: hypothetical protein U0599_15680 [Vicinamibacteria bacterium]